MAGHEPQPPAVLITGSSTGIGEACALELGKRGFHVYAGVRRQSDGQRLQQAAAQLTPLIIDVTAADSIAAAAATLRNALGSAGLAGLVNNAGIGVGGPLEIIPLDDLRRQLEVNVIGQIAVTQAMLPLLRAARGRIVNIGSMNGALAPPYMGPYAASKYALEALSDALRLELRNAGVKVSIVEPGPIATPIWQKSLAATDHLTEVASPELAEFYRADQDAMRRAVEQIAAAAWPVEHVVRAVVHALSARRPKIRYFIGWRTRLSFKAFKMVPDRIRDGIVRRALGLR
jgi:NAD(P)-dependent dehydrogenase (short-subunit alcohol dehydrogenase family)